MLFSCMLYFALPALKVILISNSGTRVATTRATATSTWTLALSGTKPASTTLITKASSKVLLYNTVKLALKTTCI